MFIIVSLDAILIVLGVLAFIGVGFAGAITTWLLQHAILVLVVFLILRICTFCYVMSEWGLYSSIAGWIFSALQFLIGPILMVAIYLEMIGAQAGALSLSNGLEMLFWLIVTISLDGLWEKAASKGLAPLVPIAEMLYVVFALFVG